MWRTKVIQAKRVLWRVKLIICIKKQIQQCRLFEEKNYAEAEAKCIETYKYINNYKIQTKCYEDISDLHGRIVIKNSNT